MMNRILQQEQQGFFPSIADINCQPFPNDPEEMQKPFDYQPRVILRTPIQKKLPVQMIDPVNQIPIIESGLAKMLQDIERESILREQPKSAFEKYTNGSSYKLVYTKTRKVPLIANQDNFAKRQINLSSIQRYDPSNYVALKQQKLQKQVENGADLDSLVFDSRFECGNLLCVYKSLKETNTYDCFIENDTNTSGYNQWFFFSVQNMRKQVSYKFNLVNMSKKFSFYKMGMKPTLFSACRFKKEGNGWYQRGYSIKYKPSDIFDVREGAKMKLYCLSFELDFDAEQDYVTISSGAPYSYSRLIRQLKIFKHQAHVNDIAWIQQTVCHTISCNQVPYLTISKKNVSTIQEQNAQDDKKSDNKVIVIFARQHSGQMNSSFIMEKILKVLSSNTNSKIQWLLNRYQFRIFPMVNVDGVIYGNFRCDLVGFDLNRCWKRPIVQLHPQVFAIKREIENLNKKHKVVCCVDLHSHSKQFNVFSYCNRYDEIESRLFSLIVSKNCPFFHFPSCTFGLSKEKQSTARAVIGSLIPNQNAMTIQSSSFGYKKQNDIRTFDSKACQDIANAILASLKLCYGNSKYKKNMLAQIQENLFKYKAYCKKNWQVNSGSDSQPNSGTNQLELKLKAILPKQLIDKICKKMKDERNMVQASRLLKRQEEPQSSEQGDMRPKRDKILRIANKKPSLTTIQPKMQGVKKRQNEKAIKKNIDRQVSIELPPPCVWRSNKLSNKRIKTEPRERRIMELKEPSQQYSIRYSTPNKVATNHNAFKNSMKILYRQLKSNTQQEEEYESQLLINNAKQMTQRKLDMKNSNKLEMILKVRRRANNFKSILSREREASQELTLLKIRSEYSSSTVEAINSSISPIITTNSKINELISPRDALPRDRYVSHITFLNKFLRNNIKETLKPQQ